MNLEDLIRNQAKSYYWQSLYKASKENGIQLFENKTNLSGLQVIFLYWLEIYSILYELIAKREYDFLDAQYLNSHIKVDAFLYYRKRHNELELAKIKEERIQSKHKFKGKPGKQTYFDVEFA
jgi:hypothetical protein